MDDADLSDDRIQAVIDHGIQKARSQIGRGLIPLGVCHWCESPLHNHQLLFCPDDSCAADWQHDHDKREARG